MIKRRICVFCETWASGGIESFLTNVLLRQEMSEMEIDLVAAEKRDSVYTAALEARGIRFISLSGSLLQFMDIIPHYIITHFSAQLLIDEREMLQAPRSKRSPVYGSYQIPAVYNLPYIFLR